MAKYKIRHAGFTYFKEHDTVDSGTGQEVKVWTPVLALRGETVDVKKASDIKKGLDTDAFWLPEFHPITGVLHEGEGEDASEVGGLQVQWSSDIDTATDDELVDFVQRATVKEVVDAADTPARAQRLLDAEKSASGDDARKTVVKKLTKLVDADADDSGTEDDDDEDETEDEDEK